MRPTHIYGEALFKNKLQRGHHKKLEECLNGRNLPNTLGKYNITKNSGETPLNWGSDP